MNTKKGMAMNFIVMMVILIVALIIIIMIYRSTLTTSGENIQQTQQEAFADTDGDGIPNIRDRCPEYTQGAEVDFNGCPNS